MTEEKRTPTPEELAQALAQAREDAYNAIHPESWVWDESVMSWVPPIPVPIAGKPYIWDERTKSWEQVPGYPYE